MPENVPDEFGQNEWLVEEMYEKYLSNPDSVGPSWQRFFKDYRHLPASLASAISDRISIQNSDKVSPPKIQEKDSSSLSSFERAVVKNMESSLSVPTATSLRSIPAKLLIANRNIINRELRKFSRGKISFTHIVGYGVIKALIRYPEMTRTYDETNGGEIIEHKDFGLGLAVDFRKQDGKRALYVPVIKTANQLSFSDFVANYEDLIRRTLSSKLTVSDFEGAVVTLTNPGTLGTEHSIPRLMKGQSLIVGVGAIVLPAALRAASREIQSLLGLSKEITITSTYDHRVIQGAQSGEFLGIIEGLLLGEHDFYNEIFDDLGIDFKPFTLTRIEASLDVKSMSQRASSVKTLVNNYRVRGHLLARLDPLGINRGQYHHDLNPENFGLGIWDLETPFPNPFHGAGEITFEEILDVLSETYCSSIGYEYMFIQEPEQKKWIQANIEGKSFEGDLDTKRFILMRLSQATLFEEFLHKRYIGQKRFGLEGSESAVVICDGVLNELARNGLKNVVVGMAHRGRLNFMVNIVGKSYAELFKEFEGELDPNSVQGGGDVKYHQGASGTYKSLNGDEVKINLVANPSHLEAVDPVVEGIARAMQDEVGENAGAVNQIVPILFHGDAAFAGEGVVAETLNLSSLKGYSTGGTIHVVINNQVGFTTSPSEGRSSTYATDVAKMVQAPIFHVNGDNPEACWFVAELAAKFRNEFHKDVVIDLICYRKHGHNELDDPSFTQPLMYQKIEKQRSTHLIYLDKLLAKKEISTSEVEQHLSDYENKLKDALDNVRGSLTRDKRIEQPIENEEIEEINAEIPEEFFSNAFKKLTEIPKGFNIHPRLLKIIEGQKKLFESAKLDWAMGETLAYASILRDGISIRITGQDTRRGTFSHRHALWVDYENGSEYFPLKEFCKTCENGSKFQIYDSSLCEYAALGFEYGYSVKNVKNLVIWEAQFGDFVNGAQVIVDNFVASAKEKWGQESSLTMYLPHGYEGQGPEHSSCRLERFLELCAYNNLVVAQPSSPSQMFHLLRFQALSKVKTPLIIATPKSLLRLNLAQSALNEIASGKFREVLEDEASELRNRSVVRRLIICSGKAYYDLLRAAKAKQHNYSLDNCALVRLELIYPFPQSRLSKIIDSYPNLEEVFFYQDEPRNMGIWPFAKTFLEKILAGKLRLKVVSRRPSGSPATGSSVIHELEASRLLNEALN